ncbi:hypothetical protein D9757_012861 [Collybiopsis confluens]|uniref:Uncharacterized protein n=1 Tax=Collybiopsis confluens TaxID=2823264 RepID=A0A8H5LGU4_9AGAR|nr:hypothetical protein D9757_012861 [Collybiopsis confluens]
MDYEPRCVLGPKLYLLRTKHALSRMDVGPLPRFHVVGTRGPRRIQTVAELAGPSIAIGESFHHLEFPVCKMSRWICPLWGCIISAPSVDGNEADLCVHIDSFCYGGLLVAQLLPLPWPSLRHHPPSHLLLRPRAPPLAQAPAPDFPSIDLGLTYNDPQLWLYTLSTPASLSLSLYPPEPLALKQGNEFGSGR